MAFVHGKGAKVWFDETDLSNYFNEASSSSKVDAADATTFGHDSKVYKPGLIDGSATTKGLFDGDAGAVDEVLEAVLGAATDSVVTVSPAGATVGNRVKIGEVISTEYQVSVPVADMVSTNATFQGDGGILGGVLLAPEVSLSTTTNGTGVDDLGAASSNGGLAVLHVLANTRDGTNIVKVQHSTDDISYADLATFTTVPAATTTSEAVTVAAGTTVNRYLRYQDTVAGSTGSATLVVSFARKV